MMKRSLAAVVVAGLMLGAVQAQGAFVSRQALVLRGARVVGGPHTDFPVLVSITGPALRTTANGGNVENDNAYDMEFRADDFVTVLDHEIESYDPVAGTLVAWVRLPSITNGVDTTFHLYFGDASIDCARNNPSRVWDPDFRYVYHLAETAGDPADSTSNAVVATRNPTGDPAMVEAPVAGWIGGALDLVAAPVVPPAGQFLPTTPTHVQVGDGALPADPAFTMEAWFRFDTKTTSAFYGFFSKGRDSSVDWIGEYALPLGVNHRFGLGWPLPDGNLQNIPTLNTAQWYHGVVSSTGGATPTRTVYLDGVAIATDTAGTLGAIALPARLGDDSNGSYLDGPLDEVRFSNVARSGNWIQTTFQNHRCPSLTAFPAGCNAGDNFIDDLAAAVPAALPSFSNATTSSGLGLAGSKEGGLSWADFNSDGCLDVLVNAVADSRLYLQQKSDTCTGVWDDVTQCLAGGLLATPHRRSGIWADLDADGYLDFAVSDITYLEVFLSNGPGTTTGVGCPAAGVAWSQFGASGLPSQTIDGTTLGASANLEGLAWIDIRGDGDVDLVFANQDTSSIEMFANNGAGTLNRVGGLAGVATGATDYCAAADFNGDGYADFLGRTSGAPDLYRNDGGFGWTQMAFNVVAENTNKGGAAFCDLDADGDFDLIWTDGPTPTRAWEQTSPGTFALRAGALPGAGLDLDGVACGDLDNDTDLDVVMTESSRDYILRNDGGWIFTDVTPGAGFGAGDGEGVVLGDTDRDGDLDILINQDGGNEYWRNELGSDNYLMVRALTDPDGAGPWVARDAIGATVTLRDCAGTLMAGVRDVNGAKGHGSQDPTLVHFGLPTSGLPRGPGMVYVVEVQFPGGLVRQQAVVPAAQGCYQQLTVLDTVASDTSMCAATAVELMSFTACGEDQAVDLSWETGSELDNLGFHLYRSPSESGPWERITDTLIPGLGSSPLGRSYGYLDPGLQNGRPYFYELEDIETTGRLTRHGPVGTVPSADAAGCSAEDPAPEDPEAGSGELSGPGSDSPGTGPAPPAEGPDEGPPPTDVEPCPTCPQTYGDPGGTSFRVLSRSTSGLVVELRTPGFVATPGPTGVQAHVPGFDLPTSPAAPALPFKRALVDALVGRSARVVSVQAADVLAVPDLVPAAVGEPFVDAAADGTVRALRRPASLDTTTGGVLPSPAVRVASDAFLGETKTLVLEMSPLRYDTASGELLLARTLTARIVFDSEPSALETGSGSRGRRPPRSRGRGAPDVLAYLHTRETGLHAVTFDDLFPARPRPIPVSSLKLSREGEPVPFHIEPSGRLFRSGSVLYFVASRSASSTDYVAETSYALVQARDGMRMTQASGAPHGGPVSSAPLARESFETNRIYQAGLLRAPDIWLWKGANGGASRTVFFSLGGVDLLSPLQARIEVHLQGASDSGTPGEHHVSVSLNGMPVGERSFEGKQPYVFDEDADVSALLEGENALTLTNLGDTGVYSLVFLDRVEVAFPQSAALRDGRFEGEFLEGGAATVTGRASVVVDVTDPESPVWLEGTEPGAGSTRLRAEAGHRYVLAATQGLRVPRVSPPVRSNLGDAANQAEYVLIAPDAFMGAARPLLARREDQGLTTYAASFEEITAVFGHGRPSAQAIRDFLAYAFHSWQRPSPRYVLLLGDSSYDPRNYSGQDRGSPLPALWTKTSYLWTASDPALAAVNGEDRLPDIALGRLPATTVAEAEALVQKVLDWEDSGQGLGGDVVLVADNPDAGGDFEADVEDIRTSYLSRRSTATLRIGDLGGATRPEILSAFDGGASLMSYVGHGGTAVWASENVLNSWDPPALLAQPEQPLMLTMNCLSGYFVAPSFDSLSEAFLKVEGRGTIAAFSPTGLSLDGPAHAFHRALMAEITSGAHARLGDAVLAAQAAYARSGRMPELLEVYHLLGDPALLLW